MAQYHARRHIENQRIAVAGPPPQLTNPNALAINNRLADFVTTKRITGRRTNTGLAYDPKEREYNEFCEHVYPTDPFKYVLNQERAYRFLFYTAFREKKATGKVAKEEAEGVTKTSKKKAAKKKKGRPPPADGRFDSKEYDVLFAHFQSETTSFPTAQDPVGPTTFNTYKAVIKNIHRQQQRNGANSIPWEFIWSLDCKDLEKHVKERVTETRKANFKEKHQGFIPYMIVEQFPRIEEALWKDVDASNSRRSLNTRLRHRMCLLYMTSGVLRSDSLYKAECSDFFGVSPPKRKVDVHRPWVLINEIAEGKTCHGKLQYGRAIRHADVKRCAVGGIAMYLHNRVDITDEFASMTLEEWKDNSKWFDIKFLIDVATKDNCAVMTSDGYSDHIKKVLQDLNLPTNKLLHLGRGTGGRALEVDEVPEDSTRRMGQ